MFSDQNCLTISEHLQLTVMEPLVLFRLEQESQQLVLVQCWPLHKQRLILHMLAFHMLAFHMLAFHMLEYHMLEFHMLEFHMLVRSTLVRKDHTLASGSSALEASTSASSALAMKA